VAHVDLRGEVEHDLGARPLEQLEHRPGVTDVGLDQLGAALERRRQVLPPAGRDVVHHGHLVAAVEQRVDEVRADEAGAACHEGPHATAHGSRGRSRGRLAPCYRRSP
jgi:hypothetical protein